MSEHVEPKPKTVKIPGPDHPISVERNASRVVVTVAGRIVADTRKALTLREASYPPVQYIPRKDVDMTLLARTDHATYCPYKGDCAYYSIPLGGVRSANAVWTRGMRPGRFLRRPLTRRKPAMPAQGREMSP